MTDQSGFEAKPPLRVVRIFWGAFVVMLVLGIGWLMMPICELIPDSQLPVFESNVTMEQRAARGEPFEKKGKHWYICKSRLARAFFF